MRLSTAARDDVSIKSTEAKYLLKARVTSLSLIVAAKVHTTLSLIVP